MATPNSTKVSAESASGSAVNRDGDAHEGALLIHESASSVASSHSWLPHYWRPTSSFSLAYAEALVLNRISDCELDCSFVMLPCGAEIRTLRATAPGADPVAYARRRPLLLLHGMGAAVGIWCRNIGQLSRQRPVYAIDILGFGRSSRVPFPLDAAACEARFVDSIEQWRLAAGLPEGLLVVGHSFGGYLAFCYSAKYPASVAHLLLADPWGMLPPPPGYEPPPLLRRIASVMDYWRLDPLDLLRAAGPFGPGLVRRLRGDLRNFFEDDGDGSSGWVGGKSSGDEVLDYVYHCNAQVPSGETGFRRLCHLIAFARRPCLSRIDQLPAQLPLTVLYGGRSRLYRLERARGEPNIGEKLRSARPAGSTQVGGVRELPQCGHHIYAEDWRSFNAYVLEAFEGYD
ncbi:hypothetical protein BOX15_Mlig031881g2 [Macrostomum lignano]|uniref:AB hydrolase-1 domain-containing protein n=1 Tax=Macrostomum lignano TaxID=282301 RepID=A0A267EYS9_9PLAT|nr:hypothetical protein BOX15_Mlig031881g2 [Macrostomum lignano]